MQSDLNHDLRASIYGVVLWNVFWVVMLCKYPDWALCHPRRLFGVFLFAATIFFGNLIAIYSPFATSAVLHVIGKIFK